MQIAFKPSPTHSSSVPHPVHFHSYPTSLSALHLFLLLSHSMPLCWLHVLSLSSCPTFVFFCTSAFRAAPICFILRFFLLFE